MDAVIKAWRTIRKIYMAQLDKFSIDQLNKVPEKFNNNIIWNIGHVIATQQSLVYKASGLPMHIPEDFFNRYKPGTKPSEPVSKVELEEIKLLLTSPVEKTEADLASGKFLTYTERTTMTGFHLGNLQDALVFNNYHEGMHIAYINSIARFV